jgi:cellulose synthase/poly-beta-1,6-N-acetylglucosamine synthase-like glycosyltransferase
MNFFINQILTLFEYLLFAYFGFAALYIFIFAFAGLFNRKKSEPIVNKLRKFVVLIPGYKEDAVILEVAQKALDQSYSNTLYRVVVIADSFEEKTLTKLKRLPIDVIEVSFEKSTKSKALNKAMEVLGDDFDVALVLDADNIMKPDFIQKINDAFNTGFQVVQGHRIAKNTNTPFAILDAISEEINNHIFRKGHRSLGFSSALIGSGMAFEYQFFKKTMATVNAVGGFDKELELKLLKAGVTIEYVQDAFVLDEKVQKPEVFENQRKRWLSAQFIYFRRYFFSGLRELLMKGNVDYFDKVYQMITPPRILLLGIVTIITLGYTVADLFFDVKAFVVAPLFWYSTFITTILAFIMAMPKKFYTLKTVSALATLPKAFIILFASLFKLKGANKKFIHTQHGTVNN